MNYLIDYDTRQVECKAKTSKELEAYIKDNDLGMAVCLVDSEDELALQMSLEEMQDLYANITLDDREFGNEDDAAAHCWSVLNSHDDDFLNYTPALGKKLLKAGQSRSADGAKGKSTASKAKPAKQTSGAKTAPQKRLKLEGDEGLIVVDAKCKAGSILDTIVTAINVEMCDSVVEVVDYITNNHIIPKTGELTDEKFAYHNVKYFIKQGKIKSC